MVSQVMEQVNRRLISYTSYSSATREHTRSKAKNKHKVALMTCIFFLLVTFALAIFFGYQGNVWLSIAAIGPFLASLLAVLCIIDQTAN